MFKKLDFSKVEIFIVDPDLNTRQSVKTVLYNNGFREVRLGKTLQDVSDVLTKYMPDLLICSCDLHDGDFIDYTKAIRKGEVGNNPFIPIIMLVEEPTPELVGRIVESGTDTVIAKPISTAQLLDRIDDIIEARKQFIVNEEYVGPARKKDGQIRGVDAPNTLKAKAEGEKLTFNDIENMIIMARGQMKTAHLDVIGAEIASHVTNLVPMLERGGRIDPTIRQELLGLLDITDNSEERLAGSEYEHVTLLCHCMGNVASSILAARGGAPNEQDVRLLKPLSQAIQACFSGAITNAAQVEAIVDQIGAR